MQQFLQLRQLSLALIVRAQRSQPLEMLLDGLQHGRLQRGRISRVHKCVFGPLALPHCHQRRLSLLQFFVRVVHARLGGDQVARFFVRHDPDYPQREQRDAEADRGLEGPPPNGFFAIHEFRDFRAHRCLLLAGPRYHLSF
jgi:hypothetical protein